MAGLEFRIIGTGLGLSFKNPKPLDRAVKPADDVAEVFRKVAAEAGNRKIGRLMISCHAYMKDGKFTIFLGSVGGVEGIRVADVGIFAPLRGKFSNGLRGIELQVCNVGENGSGLTPREAPSVASGAELCQAIANATGTGVIASTEQQPVDCLRTSGEYTERVHGLPVTRTVVTVTDCEDTWTGNLWVFTPGGRGAKPLR
jgi:hypothetical protein